MRYLYTLLLCLLMPFVWLKLLYRGIKAPAYWQRWTERMGFFPMTDGKPTIWLHAVSVGEVQAATPFIQAIKRQYPHCTIVVTTMTPTGLAQAKKTFADTVVSGHLPYDLPWSIALFLKRVRPQVAIVMETELWPNLFHACHQSNIPLMIANARLSPKSTSGYQRIKPFVKQTLANVTCIAAQSEDDAQRFVEIGAIADRVMVTKNIKFDFSPVLSSDELVNAFRASFGIDKKIWIAASTHEGEDELVLDVYSALLNKYPELVLMIVPRHPERFNSVASMAEKRAFSVSRRSRDKFACADTQVFIGDSMGELMFYYQAADLAFVGGSLVATGGHNMLEPAALGLATVTGPHTFNFKEIMKSMLATEAVIQVQTVDELRNTLSELLGDESRRHEIGERALGVFVSNKGATTLLMARLDAMLPTEPSTAAPQQH